MTDSRSGKDSIAGGGIEDILAERARLEKILEEKYVKEVTILFSDICGYTRYVDRHGDISGRAMLIQHNRIVLPAIQKYDGLVIEVIGDAVMAAFFDPLKAIFSAVEIQGQLAAYNASVASSDAIRVKIGIHVGRALVDEDAAHQRLTGDVANLAARIQELAGKDQILISSVLYDRVCGSEDVLCRFHDNVELKGKAEPQTVYRVVWQDEELMTPEAARLRTYRISGEPFEPDQPRVLNLEAGRDGGKLLIGAHEGSKGESLTIRDYEATAISMQRIESRCRELVDSLNRANQRGRVSREVFLKLREIGQILYDDLFTSNIKERLKYSSAPFLCLNLDESLIHIPWELLHNGRRFLCERFAIGRIVKTRHPLSGSQERMLARPLRFMIIADPTGDLKGAYREGTRIRDLLDNRADDFNVALRADAIKVESIRKKLRNFDIVHFAGHADHKSDKPDQSGWRLSDGFFTTQDIGKMAGTSAMPALIFSNSCQSARTENIVLAPDFQNEIFGMANSFLLAGVRHYIGTFWEIMDEPSSRFALTFYENLADKASIGEAVQLARQSLIQQYGENNIVWASYLLYGDPSFNYLGQLARPEARSAPTGESPPIPEEAARTREEVIDFGKTEAETSRKRRRLAIFAVALAVLALMAGFLYEGRENPGDLEQRALTAFRSGDYAKAGEICQSLQQKYPQRPMSHLILGDLNFLQNRTQAAGNHYRLALEDAEGFAEEAAQALVGLGRIFSLQGEKEQALAYYQQAAERSPGDKNALVSKAALLVEGGRYEESIALFRQAAETGANDPLLTAAINEVQRRRDWERDVVRQQRIDQLVDELTERVESGELALQKDDWSSQPLTVWFMDLDVRGAVLQEGAGFLLHSVLVEEMLQNGRLHMVERGLMDKLLEELRLGSGHLADKDTALAVGRIAAAKVILNGRLFQQESSQQVTLRAIETETGEIFASISRSMDNSFAAAERIQSLSRALLEKLFERFPLRGKISNVEGSIATIDIGSKHGVEPGLMFKPLDSDALLRIESVEADQSLAVLKDKSVQLAPGVKVEMVAKTRF